MRETGPKRVLEIGVGTLQQSQYHYVGVPHSVRYINIDRRVFPHVHVLVDLDEGLPFKDETFVGVFTAHCLEHLSFASVTQMLREIYRVLQPLGTVKIILPDFSYWIRRYQEEGWTEAVWTNLFGQQLYHGDFHLSGWDPDSLLAACRAAGFQALVQLPRTEDELKVYAVKVAEEEVL